MGQGRGHQQEATASVVAVGSHVDTRMMTLTIVGRRVRITRGGPLPHAGSRMGVAPGVAANSGAVRAGDIGSCAGLQARAAVGDGLDLHHMPQTAAGLRPGWTEPE